MDKYFVVSIEVSGSIDLKIVAESKDKALKIAEKIADKLNIDGKCWEHAALTEVDECIEYEVES